MSFRLDGFDQSPLNVNHKNHLTNFGIIEHDMIGQFFSGHYYSIMGPKTGKFFSAEILSDFHQITSTNLMKNRATNFSLLYATNFLMQCRSMLEAELSHAELRFDNREYNICFKTDVFIWQCSVVEFGTFIKAIHLKSLIWD